MGAIAPTGKLRVAIGISPAGGAYWSTRTEAGGYAGVPVDLGKDGRPARRPGGICRLSELGPDHRRRVERLWDVTFLPQDPEREAKMLFGPIYEVADATYIVKAGSPITNFATLDQPGVKVAAVNNTTTMRGAIAHLRTPGLRAIRPTTRSSRLLKNGEIDAFALSRDQLDAMAKKIPGTRVLDETFKQTVTAVAVPLNHPLALEYATKFMTEATSNGVLRKAFDHNGLKDIPLRAQ